MKSESSLKFCVSYICLTLRHMNCIPSQKHCDGWCDRPFWVFSPRKMQIASGQQHVFCFNTTRDKEFNQTRITSSRRLKISKHWLWQLTWFHNHMFSYSFIMMWGIYLVLSVRSFCLTEIHMAMCRLGGRVQTCKMILNYWISSWQKCLMHDDWWPLIETCIKKNVLLGGKDWDRKTLGRNGAKWAGKPKSFRVSQLIFMMWTTFSRWRMETTLFALHLWMHLSRYKGTFSPQFHAFGYEGRAGLLSPWLNKTGAVHSWFVLICLTISYLCDCESLLI